MLLMEHHHKYHRYILRSYRSLWGKRRDQTSTFGLFGGTTTTTNYAVTSKLSNPELLQPDTKAYPIPTTIYFPWRHESINNPIPRLIPGTDEYRNDIRFKIPAQNFMAYTFLKLPFWQYQLNPQRWRNDLANGCAYAFTHGVACTLADIYSLRLNQVINTYEDELDDVRIHFLYPSNKSALASKEENEVRKDPILSEKLYGHSKQMLSEPLRSLFQSSYTKVMDQYQIRLEIEPVKASLYNILGAPFIARSVVERDRDLRHNVFKLINDDFESEAVSKVVDTVTQNAFEQEFSVQTTIEVQVLVTCMERFQVTDRHSGAIVQGSLDCTAREVMHVVRLERTVTSSWQHSLFFSNLNYGHWQITDIDDLLFSKPWLRP